MSQRTGSATPAHETTRGVVTRLQGSALWRDSAFLKLWTGQSISLEATANSNSPIPKPSSIHEGGQFEPTVDPVSGRLMDSNSEYKVLSTITETHEEHNGVNASTVYGTLYLYAGMAPCASCNSMIN